MLEVKIFETQQVHVMRKCPGVVLVMVKGDEGDGGTGQCRDQGTASEWTLSNNCALGSPCIPTIITLFPWSSYSTMLLFEL